MYVTVQEFKNAPTAIDTYSLIPNGTQAQNDAELHNVLVRASAWVDQICNQTLEATSNTEIKEVTMNTRGLIRIHPNNAPIISLADSVQYKVDPMGPWNSIPINCIQLSNRYFTIYNLNTFGVPPSLMLQYPNMAYRTPTRMRSLQSIPIIVQYTYVNGYANTMLSGASLVGATQLTVANPVGITVGQKLTIYDSASTEDVVVSAVNGSVITVTSPTLFAHASGTSISALPATIKEATILLAAYLIKERGSLAISMNETSLQGVNHYKDAADVETAKQMISNFKRGITS